MKRIITWGSFVVIVGLVVWGLIAAENKSSREKANAILPDNIVATDHVRGDADAAVTLVEYGDFQCPGCASFHPIVERLVESSDPSVLRFVFRHFPLTQHAHAMSASQAAEAAGMQGKFWEMYGLLYENQAKWQSAKDAKIIFVGYAVELGLDKEKFLTDFDLDSVKDKIYADYKGGSVAGVNSTPTFFVNGKQISNPRNYEEFKAIIDNAVPKINF